MRAPPVSSLPKVIRPRMTLGFLDMARRGILKNGIDNVNSEVESLNLLIRRLIEKLTGHIKLNQRWRRGYVIESELS